MLRFARALIRRGTAVWRMRPAVRVSAFVAAVSARKSAGQPVLLNLGCGELCHPAWINIDTLAQPPQRIGWDLALKLPVPTDSCDAIYASHVVEHFHPDAAPGILAGWYDALRPGGILRVVVPDLEENARAYLRALDEVRAGLPEAEDRHEWMTIELLDQLVRNESGGRMLRYWARPSIRVADFVAERAGDEFRNARRWLLDAFPALTLLRTASEVGRFRMSGEPHLWMYDAYSLAVLFRKAGFKAPATMSAGQSRIPGFRGFDLDMRADGLVRKPFSVFMEASKV
ncbi:MAG: methyltransferase domain-containing protein [Magnetospirillum sp.]|nr:methyltransferase domain-containing protein [Magnetospirillum sp.]